MARQRTSNFKFDEAKMLQALDPYGITIAARAAPTLLSIAQHYNNQAAPTNRRGSYNPSPGSAGHDGAGGVYRISGQFISTLTVRIDRKRVIFESAAERRGFAYGQALIHGGKPFKGAYRLLPNEFYEAV